MGYVYGINCCWTKLWKDEIADDKDVRQSIILLHWCCKGCFNHLFSISATSKLIAPYLLFAL